jgi:hypothetical protein
LTASTDFTETASAQSTAPHVFIGVDVAFDNITATKQLADNLRGYANLFIIGCSYGIGSRNSTRLNDLFDLCQYLYERDYYFIIFENVQPPQTVVNYVRQYGDRFLGFYAYDEMGGRQLDQSSNNPHFNKTDITYSDNYREAADFFVNRLNGWMFNTTSPFAFVRPFNSSTEFRLFTSDYSLYYYDYKAGYDVVLAEIVWNYSRQLNVALCRGAAMAQGKDWGTMIGWKYDQPPYLGSSLELYDDLVTSYDNGAKYIVLFDSNANYTQTTLTSDHIEAIKSFWNYTQDNPRNTGATKKVAYVLPEGYGYGFRGPEDKIWGIWDADMTSFMLSISVNIMLQKYGSNVDIIYEDPQLPNSTFGYSEVVYWNNPAAVSDLWPKDWPIPTISPSPIKTSVSNDQNLQINYFYIGEGGLAAIVIVVVGLLFRLRRQKSESAH